MLLSRAVSNSQILIGTDTGLVTTPIRRSPVSSQGYPGSEPVRRSTHVRNRQRYRGGPTPHPAFLDEGATPSVRSAVSGRRGRVPSSVGRVRALIIRPMVVGIRTDTQEHGYTNGLLTMDSFLVRGADSVVLPNQRQFRRSISTDPNKLRGSPADGQPHTLIAERSCGVAIGAVGSGHFRVAHLPGGTGPPCA